MAVPLSQLAAGDPMNRPPKPSPTGIIGWCWVTAFELRTAAESSLLTLNQDPTKTLERKKTGWKTP